MLYDAVIFDLDGTLTDSSEGIFASTRYALNRLSLPVPDDATLRRFIGPPLADSFMRYCGMTEPEAVHACALYRERYVPIGWKENRVYPVIREMLRALKSAGVYLAVATGKPQDSAETVLRYFGLLPYFDKVCGPDNTTVHVDKGDLIAQALPPVFNRALMVGDSPGDVLGAHARGIDSAAALWGFGDPDEMAAAAPTCSLHTPRELYHFLLHREPPRGLFITLEGVDGCGKTTQQKKLAEKLTQFGFPVYLSREPGGCPIAEDIRKIVLAQEDGGMCAETEALLFAASRAQHVREIILPKMQQGVTVVCDRFIDSSVVYQATGRGLDKAWVLSINAPALAVGTPDMTVYLRLPRAEALRRRGNASSPDRIEQAGDGFFARAERAYETLCAENPDRFVPVDGHGTPDEVAERVWQAVWRKMDEKHLD